MLTRHLHALALDLLIASESAIAAARQLGADRGQDGLIRMTYSFSSENYMDLVEGYLKDNR